MCLLPVEENVVWLEDLPYKRTVGRQFVVQNLPDFQSKRKNLTLFSNPVPQDIYG